MGKYRPRTHFARQVHASLARAIRPFATASDGDTLFAVTTNAVESDEVSCEDPGMIASEVAWDAVLSSVPQRPERTPLPAVPVQLKTTRLDALAGNYRLSPWTQMQVFRTGDALEVRGPEQWNLHFPGEGTAALTPISDCKYLLQGKRGGRIHFEQDNGRITGLVINREGWPARAAREQQKTAAVWRNIATYGRC